MDSYFNEEIRKSNYSLHELYFVLISDTFVKFYYSLDFERDFGDEINPINTQSASKMVKSFSSPKNRDDNSSSLMRSFTLAPLTYKLEIKYLKIMRKLKEKKLFRCDECHLLSIFLRSNANTMEFPTKIYIQIISDNMNNLSGY